MESGRFVLGRRGWRSKDSSGFCAPLIRVCLFSCGWLGWGLWPRMCRDNRCVEQRQEFFISLALFVRSVTRTPFASPSACTLTPSTALASLAFFKCVASFANAWKSWHWIEVRRTRTWPLAKFWVRFDVWVHRSTCILGNKSNMWLIEKNMLCIIYSL